MMVVEARQLNVGPARPSPAPELKHEPRTLAARKAYPREDSEQDRDSTDRDCDIKRSEDDKSELMDAQMDYEVDKECKEELPLDLSVRKVSVREFARQNYTDAADYVRARLILSQSQGFLATVATARDSGTDSDDSAGRLSPEDDAGQGKPYKKSLIKRYSKFCSRFFSVLFFS